MLYQNIYGNLCVCSSWSLSTRSSLSSFFDRESLPNVFSVGVEGGEMSNPKETDLVFSDGVVGIASE